MSGKSTLINLLYAQEEISYLSDAKRDIDSFFLDLSKTFDVVNHGYFLAKS